jgi:hypothetical protein
MSHRGRGHCPFAQVLRELLGQKVGYDFVQNVSFEVGFSFTTFALPRLIDDCEIRLRGNCHELYFEHDDVTGIAARLKAANVQFVHEPREQPWGQLVVRVCDPDGHIVEIGESLDHTARRLHSGGMTAGEISQKILMPLEFVEQAIGPKP